MAETKTCDTCVAHVTGKCRVAVNTGLPPSVRWFAREHLDARRDGKNENCFSWVDSEQAADEPVTFP